MHQPDTTTETKVQAVLRKAARIIRERFDVDDCLTPEDLSVALMDAGALGSTSFRALRALRAVTLGSPEPGALGRWLADNPRDAVAAALTSAADTSEATRTA